MISSGWRGEGGQEFKKIIPSIELMAEASWKARNMREKRGALNFDTSEAKILVDKKGKTSWYRSSSAWCCRAYDRVPHVDSQRNSCRALQQAGPTFIYRIHEEPKAEKSS